MPFDRILFATDLGPTARETFERLMLIARAHRSHVLLLHVTPSWRAFVTSGLAQREAIDRLDGWSLELGRHGVGSETRVLRGHAADTVLEVAERWGATLVVVGAAYQRGGGHHVGSTAQTIAHAASCSVWIEIPGARPGVELVLCGVDGSEGSAAALDAARMVATQHRAELVVVGAIEGPNENTLGMTASERETELSEHREKWIAELEKFVSERGIGKEVARHFAWGRGSDVLRTLAADRHADLIVIGRTGESNLRRLLLGSTAQRLLRDVPCSLLIVGGAQSR